MARSSPLYRHLCPSKEEIRLLELHPSDSSASDITASLSVVSLRDNPSYVALSYVWGGSGIPVPTISLSDHTKAVTDNLRAALYALRDKTDTRLIWIDALCINQEDNTEKDHQVKLMGKLYQKCASCWIWLGGATSIAGIETAVKLLENWASDEHLNANLNFDSTLIKTVTELTTRAWFSRIWTVQESILPKKLVICCGSHRIPWTIFADAAKNVQKHLCSPCCTLHNDTANTYIKGVDDFIDTVLTIERSRKPLHRSKSGKPDHWKSEVLTCLHHYRGRDATQQQDKIFGLHGLIDSDGQELIDFCFGLSSEDAYITFCMEHIKQTESLRALQYVVWFAEKSKLKKPLPTWVPDWILAMTESRWQTKRIDRYFLYDACGGRKSQPEFDTESGTLTDQGVRCGVVAKVGSERLAQWSEVSEETKRGSGSKKKGWGIGFLRYKEKGPRIPKDWVSIADLDSFPDKAKARTDFWRTLLMDTIRESEDPRITSYRKAIDADYEEHEKSLTKVMKGTGWPADTETIYLALETATLLRRFFVTADRRFGIGPAGMKEKDVIYVMNGGNCPLVLRSQGQAGRYSFVGDCFVVGLMKGEASEKFYSGAAEAVCLE